MSSIETDGPLLLATARRAIETQLGLAADKAPPADGPAGASFVTLTRHGELRGCIGSLEARRPLLADVAVNACNAAFKDPRFPPILRSEWPQIAIEVSVLGEIEWRACPNLSEALAWVRAGRDGVIIASGSHQATFLPQVWESLSDADDFFALLLRKAGLGGHWPKDTRVGRYPVFKHREGSLEAAS